MVNDRLPESVAALFPSDDPSAYPVALERYTELVQLLESVVHALVRYEQELLAHAPQQLLALKVGKHLESSEWRARYVAEVGAANDLIHRLLSVRRMVDRAFQATSAYCPTLVKGAAP